MQIPDAIKSRKFWAAVVALLLVFFGERAGVDGEQLQNAVYILISFILGVGLEGSNANKK